MTAYENKISRQTAPNLGILVGCAGNIRQEDKKRIRRVLKSLPYKEFELEEIENSSLYVASYAQEKSAFKKGKLGTWGRIGRNTNSYAALFQEEKTSKLTLQVDKIGNKGWFYTEKKDRLFFSTDLRVLSDISEENTINPSTFFNWNMVILLHGTLIPDWKPTKNNPIPF